MEQNQGTHEKFTCSICAKDCGNKKSQLRHIYYCRRLKSRGGVRSRKRACLACTKAKTHCDLAQPSCSRCTTRKFKCVYEGRESSRTKVAEAIVEELPRHDLNAVEEVFSISTPSRDVTPAVFIDIYEEATTSYLSQGPILNSQEILYLDLPDESWDLEVAGSLSEDVESSVVRTTSESTRRPLQHFHKEPSPIFTNFRVKDNGPHYGLYDQPAPKPLKAFTPRKFHKNQFSLNRNYILCTLPTYPSMLLPSNSDTPPPFIHPHFNNHKALPGPLATCAIIVRWISIKNEDNIKHIWGCIKMEIERICAQYLTYDEEDTVAALQAITIYFLLRLSEDNEEVTDFDVPLVYTMIKVSIQVVYLAENSFNDNIPSWKRWALAESARRTIIILFFVDLFFDVSSAVPEYRCDGSHLRAMSLPCSRKLWRATTNEEWQTEYTNAAKNKRLTFGDLISSRSRLADHALDGWLSQLDDFGMLVLSAASLAS